MSTNGMNESNLKHCEGITREILKSKFKLEKLNEIFQY